MLALLVALAPIAIRYMDRQTVTRIAVVAADAGARAIAAIAVTDSLLNIPPAGVDAADWEKPYRDRARRPTLPAAERRSPARRPRRDHDRRATAERPGRRHATGPTRPRRTARGAQLLGFAAYRAIGILDWTRDLPPDRSSATFHDARLHASSRIEHRRPRAATPLDPQEAASRAFLGIVFVVLLFITVVIYGMWVATGVAAEKSSRVMELMISAASPAPDADRQGRRDRRGRADPVRGDRGAGARAARVPGPDRRGASWARTGPQARRSSA